MTVYSPFPTVEINGGIYYPDNTISRISITTGRRNIYEQPPAGYAVIELWTTADAPLTIALSDTVTVRIQDSNGDYQKIYTGTISDIDIVLEAYGDVGNIARYTLTAVGVLAILNKRTTGALGFAKEFDGTRIYNILSDAFLQAWDELSPSLEWQQVNALTTWENWDSTSQALLDNLAAQIDVPGDYELTAYSGGAANAYELAQDAAQSGRGMLYEDAEGALWYDSYSSRASQTPLVLTADDLLADGLRQAAQWSEIVNDVEVTYKNNQSKFSADGISQELYGQLAGTRETQLENGTDAQAQADAFLESRAYARTYPEELTIPLHSPTVLDTTRDALIAMKVGSSIYTQALPAVFGTVFDGFVEGMRWEIDRYRANLILTCSAISETYPHAIWLQIAPTVTWNSYTPITDRWIDL
ncbi:MAG TPA: hypothetical protein VLA40_15440 [Rheinheimera sp.]|nr:hypothetical protein [Rheinheimera sp.]